MEPTKDFTLKINKVKIEEINFREPNDSLINSFDENQLTIHINTSYTYKLEEEEVTVSLIVIYDYKNKNEKKAQELLNYKGSFEFKIGNLNEIVKKNDIGIDVPDGILEIITGVAISSARGIIIAKTAGSFINQFYLPLVSPQSIIAQLKGKIANKVVSNKK